MSSINSVFNFISTNGLIIFIVSLLVFLGRNLDKFVKLKSKISFSRFFLREKGVNHLKAAEISLEALDTVFRSRRIFIFTIPNATRLFFVSIIISSSLMIYYMIISYNKYALVGNNIYEDSILGLALLFSVGENQSEIILLILLPLLIFLANPLLDFFSYAQTRYLLQEMISEMKLKEKNLHSYIIVKYCLTDLLYSFCLFQLFIFGATNIFHRFYYSIKFSGPDISSKKFLENLIESAQKPFQMVDSYFAGLGVEGLYGGILISTFISTLFVWFVYFSFLLSYLQRFFKKSLLFINKHTHLIKRFYRNPFSIISYLFSAIAFTIDFITRNTLN